MMMMMMMMRQVLLTLVLPALAAAALAPTGPDSDSCNPDKMTVYKVVLHTYWTREKFPKHYPEWRPPAQWSKVYGVSHDRSYVLFRLGRRVSLPVRQFTESGRTEALGATKGTLDVFGGPSIPQGAGRSEAEFFVDGNHSRVSVMTRMVPSPDWFIGIDSFDLCVDGNWLDSITIEVDPIDAGTDNGFTFTAPNWPTAPQGVTYRITAAYPSHPAGSFFYPHLRRLPPIATFQFIKLREYEITEVFHRETDDRRYDVLGLDRLAHTSIDVPDGNHALSVAEEEERREEAPAVYPGDRTATTADAIYNFYSFINGTSSTTEEPRSANELPTSDTRRSGDRRAVSSLTRRYRARQRRKMHTENTDPAKRRKRRRPRFGDCVVSSWGEWSSCRNDGGCVGSASRSRTVLRRQRVGGARCPALAQSRWCALNCTATSQEDWRDNLT